VGLPTSMLLLTCKHLLHPMWRFPGTCPSWPLW
jgi:hypothetical protein